MDKMGSAGVLEAVKLDASSIYDIISLTIIDQFFDTSYNVHSDPF